jgi:NTE family protein
MASYWIERALGVVGPEDPEAWIAANEDRPPRGRLGLALQGGGSFGAFAWGVLDRLMQDDGIIIDAISGASAGAVNAVLIASGLIEGGPEEARRKLLRFWQRMSRVAAFASNVNLTVPGFGIIARSFAPHLFNPFNLNPLREALAEEVDFARLRRESQIRLMIAATRVKDGALRIFETSELTLDMVLASACLPLLHHQIVVDGETYWDGGYSANPPLVRLALKSAAEHILIVQVTPNSVAKAPTTPDEIAKRIEQIQFNATLNRELDALKYGRLLGVVPRLKGLQIDLIAAHDEIDNLAGESAANLDWAFLSKLADGGRAAGAEWLKTQNV